MVWIVGIVVAVFIGASWEGPFGAIALGLIVWLAQRSFRQERRIVELEQGPRVPAAAVVPTPEAAQVPDAAVDLPLDLAPVEPARELAPEPQPATVVPVVARVEAPEPASVPAPGPIEPAADVFAPIRAWFFGGNTIVKAGVAILFLGLAFLAKYASEHVSVPVEFRLAGIAAVAIVLLGIGWRLRLARPGYAQALQGGAVAVLYLTIFVAFRFYGVLAAGPVFVLMVVVAALAAALAVLQDARALAVIGALGGFATPLLVSTGSGNHVALFSYYLVLDLGIAAVAWFRTWRMLNLIGFAFTFLVATAWGVLKYNPEHYLTGQAFLIAFFLLFVAIMLLPARQVDDAAPASRSEAWVHGALLFGLPTISFVLQYGLLRFTEHGVAFASLGFAAFYVALAMWMHGKPRFALAFEGSLAVGTVFLTLVIPFALDARSTAGAWALEGAGLVWLGYRQSRLMARLFGFALIVLAGFALAYAHERHGDPASVLDPLLFNGVLVAIGALAAALFVHRHAAGKPGEPVAEPLLIGWATLWLVAVAVQEIDRFVTPGWGLAASLAAASAVALLYTGLAHRFVWRMVALPVMAHAAVMVGALVALMATLDDPLAGGRWWAWPVALATHAVVLWRAAPHWPARLREIVHALGALILAALGSLIGRHVTADWGDDWSAWPWLGWFVAPVLLLLWLPRPGAVRRWPLRLEPQAYQGGAAGVLALGALAWSVLANLASDGSARPLPHVPLLNPLDVGVGLALAASALWLRGPAGTRTVTNPRIGTTLLAACAFVWLNAMLIRGFHHFGGVPYRVDAWIASNAVQAGITLLWSVTALVAMWWAAKRAVRAVWVTGAALLGVVVVKLLLVDLSGSGTVARIVSFIGVGVLMLVIGYVAPLPVKEERHATP